VTAWLRLGNKAVTPVTSAGQLFPPVLLLTAKAFKQGRAARDRPEGFVSFGGAAQCPDGFPDHATDGAMGSYTKIFRRVPPLTRVRLEADGFPLRCCGLITSLLRNCNEFITGQPLPDWTNLPGPIRPAYATGIVSGCRNLVVPGACSGIPWITL
jgi:hypothetical protein